MDERIRKCKIAILKCAILIINKASNDGNLITPKKFCSWIILVMELKIFLIVNVIALDVIIANNYGCINVAIIVLSLIIATTSIITSLNYC